jgi:hypothetical protein
LARLSEIPDALILFILDARCYDSSHLSGDYHAFADGSVHFIPFTVNPTAFLRACVRDDGQAFNLNDLF